MKPHGVLPLVRLNKIIRDNFKYIMKERGEMVKMFQNVPQQSMNYYPQYGGQYQQRLDQMMQNQMMYPQMSNQTNYLKGRPVVSIEEARAAQIDLDGSLFIFTDIGNKKIYTKQINLDGTATLNTYSLEDKTLPATESFVTKSELEEILSKMREEFKLERESANEQHGDVKKTIIKQSSF